MKKITIVAMLLIFSATTFCQETQPAAPLTREEYLKKSKNAKIAGFVVLGLGLGVLVVASQADVDYDALGTLVFVGGILTLTSIPIFISAGKNKRRAKNATVGFKFERTQTLQQNAISFRSVPALSIKLQL